MKKVYEKPQVYMERFELAEHIAGCSLTLNAADEFSCTGNGFINGIETLVFASMNVCNPDDGIANVEGYCYTPGSMSVANINS